MLEKKSENIGVLLHVCCAICGVRLAKILKEKFSRVILFYSNSNIHPKEEYEKRKSAAELLAIKENLEFFADDYDPEKWFAEIKGLEGESEGGLRCPICFSFRLKRAADFARKNNLEYFCTTLAISPFKNEELIENLALKIGSDFGVDFIKLSEILSDKKETWQEGRKEAKNDGFYSQNYCGCLFSRKKID